MTNRFARGSWIAFGLISLMGCASTATKSKLTSEERSRLIVNVANGALVDNDPTGALQALAEAEKLGVNLPELHHSKSIAYFMKHDLNAAIREARMAVEIAPHYSEANNTYGKLLIEAGRLKEAEEPLLRAASDNLYRDSYKPNTNLGILYYKQGKTVQSLVRLNRATEGNPNACVAFYYIGHIRLAAGNFNEAIRNYDLATQKFCANFVDAHLAMGIAFERSKRFDQARRKYLDIKQNFPDSKVAEQAIDRLRYIP